MIKIIERNPVVTIILITGLLLLPNLNFLDVTIMEARNFITAREMLTDGNWVLTTMNGEARYEKPPLPTWLTAFSAYVSGKTTIWALRLPAALMVILLSIGVYMLSRKLKISKRHSLINALITSTSLYVIVIIFEAPWDIYTHTFALFAVYGVVHLVRQKQADFKTILYICLGIASSVLSKGPIGLYALFIPFLLAYGIIYRKHISKKSWLLIASISILGLALGFSWYVYVRYADPEAFAVIAQEETANWTSFNVRPFYYYWSFFTQSGLWAIPAFISLLYPYMKSRVQDIKCYQFTLLWTLLAVILLSIIPEKKTRYLMPVLIPLALNTGYYIYYLVKSFAALKDKRETIPVYFYFGLIPTILSLGIFAFIAYLLSTQKEVVWYTYILAIVPFLISFLGLIALRRKDILRVFYLSIISLVVLTPFWLSVQRNFKFQSVHPILNTVKIYSYELDTPEVWFTMGIKAPNFGPNESLKYPKESHFLFMDYVTTGNSRHCDYLKDYKLRIVDTININDPAKKLRKRKYLQLIEAIKRL